MDNYVGEIRLFGGNFAPEGWLLCQGQFLNISEYELLYTLIGTTYGGDGQNTFAVPNLQSRVVVGAGQGQTGTSYTLGALGGQESVALTTQQLPPHQHPVTNVNVGALTNGTPQTNPSGAYFGNQDTNAYATASSGQSLNGGAVTGQSTAAGGSQPHANIQPVVALNYIIALVGVYPSPN